MYRNLGQRYKHELPGEQGGGCGVGVVVVVVVREGVCVRARARVCVGRGGRFY